MAKLIVCFLALGVAGAACNSSETSEVPAACVRPLTDFTDCAPTYAQQKTAPPGWDPRACTDCAMCHLFTGRCQDHDVWRHSWAYGERRECVYDAATGALVGAMRATDYQLDGCWELVGGVKVALEIECRADDPGVCQGR